MKKKIMSILLCLCMALTLLPTTVWAADTGHTHYLCGGDTCNGVGHNETSTTTFATEIKQANDKLYKGGDVWNFSNLNGNNCYYLDKEGTYYLSSDITLEFRIRIHANITLCLNGHTITSTNGVGADVITVGSLDYTPTFTLTDCKGTNNVYGKITHDNGKTGRGIYVSGGTFNMYGGNITGNDPSANYFGIGGGVYVDGNSSTTFNMYGGSITGNTATSGGGVYVGSGTFNMTGGSITGNNATSGYGGGVYVATKNVFTVSGNVQILDNVKGGTKDSQTGNYIGGTASNVYLLANKTITIGGALTKGAQLGVTLADSYSSSAFTEGWNKYMSGKTPSDYFTSDDAGKFVSLSDEEVGLEKFHTHYLCGGSTCNKAGGHTEPSMTTFATEIKMQDGKPCKGGTALGRYSDDDGVYYDKLDGGAYYLSSDLELKYPIKIYGDVNLCLNGHSITGNVEGRLIIVTSNSTFNLTDCKGGKAEYGSITNSNTAGGGILVYNLGNFNMYGGSITGNNAADFGGGVYMTNNTFNMYGGSITGNNAPSGGGVYIGQGGAFNMSGTASIAGNTADVGGGVCVAYGGSFTMSGGSITGNNATQNGGALVSYGTVTASGNVQIQDNVKGGTKDSQTGKYTDGTDNNVYLLANKTITIGGALADTAKIGVTLADDYGDKVFTSGWKTNMSDKTPSNYFISDNTRKGADLDGDELKLITLHTHIWTYTANDATITATCVGCEDNNNMNNSGGSLTIGKPEIKKYNDGKAAAATVTENNWQGGSYSIRYSTGSTTAPTSAGTYTASITLGDATASVDYTINEADQAAPGGLTTSSATSVGGKGKIIGTTTAMEYNTSANATSGWTACADGSTEVAPGTYYVRYKEIKNYNASPAVELTVAAHTHSYAEIATEQNLKSAATCVSPAVYYKSCSVCGALSQDTFESGSVNPDNHKNTERRGAKPATEQEEGYTGVLYCLDCGKELEKGKSIDKLQHKLKEVKAKPATAAEFGNIKYYFCEGCGKYFADAAGEKEITREDTLLPKLAPTIIEGGNTTVNSGEKKALSFRSDAAVADFLRVELDGKTLDEENYTRAADSIVVTLKAELVSTLSAGEHTLSIVSQSGTATAKFTVKTAEPPAQTPKTGDSSMMALWSLAAILSLTALGATVASKKKRER